jgi:GNAT superfamily N-acetyltransferase
MRTDEHGGDLPSTEMKNGQTVTSYPGLGCPHCPASFYKHETQASHISDKHAGQPYNHSVEDDSHRIDYYHYFTPMHPHFFVLSDKHSSQIISNMTLDTEGKVSGVETHPKYQRQGLATKLWNYAAKRGDMGIPTPQHSTIRTEAGDKWAHKIGGEVPPLAGGSPIPAGQMHAMIDFNRN